MHDYSYYQNIFAKQVMPFAFVDLDLLDRNIQAIAERATNDKTIRIASKSIRCEYVIKKILESHAKYQGIMCYSVREALYLSTKNFDDLLVAYPAWEMSQLEEVAQQILNNKKIILMVDCLEHIDRLEQVGKKYQAQMPICIDVDMSSHYKLMHFGVFRSPVHSVPKVLQLAHHIKSCTNIDLQGIMGYEAQIAGLGDNSPARDFFTNAVIRLLKKKSIQEIKIRRQQIVKELRNLGFPLPLVNGGGTGSVETTCQEDAVTEVTVGSGFFAPVLFDHYKQFQHLPAAGYAIEITRIPKSGIFTCHGGGYIASGSIGCDKQPLPYLPIGAKLITNEGAGEVQTPVVYSGNIPLKLGDPVFFRHSKAGELCEHFNTLYLVSEGKIVDEVETYRGAGQCFLG